MYVSATELHHQRERGPAQLAVNWTTTIPVMGKSIRIHWPDRIDSIDARQQIEVIIFDSVPSAIRYRLSANTVVCLSAAVCCYACDNGF